MPIAQQVNLFGQESLQIGLDPVLDKPGIHAQFVTGIVFDLVDADNQMIVGFLRLHGPNCGDALLDRKSTRLNSSHVAISYAVFCLKKKKTTKVHDACVENYRM